MEDLGGVKVRGKEEHPCSYIAFYFRGCPCVTGRGFFCDSLDIQLQFSPFA